MMPGDETIFEAPATPAPLFAYRAIRSIFFASPESTPEYEDKENVAPDDSPSPVKPRYTMEQPAQTTPLQKRKRRADVGNVEGEILLSPVKGILRTPGQATPRTKYLKDLNVKFKSVSPEIVNQQNNVEAGRAQKVVVAARPSDLKPQQKEAPKAVRSSKPKNHFEILDTSSRDPDPSNKKHTGPEPARKAEPIIPTPEGEAFSPAAIEAYIQQTEKEMKRLVRYGQKMREYARKKDAENQELKMMIERLQRENERWRKDATVTSSRVVAKEVVEAESIFAGKEETQAGRVGAPAKTDREGELMVVDGKKHRGYVREEVSRVEATTAHVNGHTRKPSFPATLPPKQKDEVQSRNPTRDRDRDTAKSSKYSSLKSAAPSARPVAPGAAAAASLRIPKRHSTMIVGLTPKSRAASSHLLLSSHHQAVGTPSTTFQDAAPISFPDPNPGPDPEAEANPNTATAGTIRLPADRLAAARDRLRRRAEARKASNSTSTSTRAAEAHVDPDIERTLVRPFAEQQQRKSLVGMEKPVTTTPAAVLPRARHHDRDREEPSELDWANL